MKPILTNDAQIDAKPATLQLFSDGGFLSKLNVGGWGFVLYQNDQAPVTQSGACRTQSSIEMELLGAVNALEFIGATLQPNQKAILHTDSRILLEGLDTKIARYKQQNWLHQSGRPVESRALWERFEMLINQHDVTLKWVKGHNGNPGNQLADQLVREAMQAYLKARHPH